jgi:CHAD domain-containing protein
MKPSYDLTGSDSASVAVRKVFRHLLEALRSQVDGIVADTDIEHLHDLRVANRRTRTALTQIARFLPSEDVETFAPDFKWIGTVTGGRRDLDVTLVELDRFQSRPDEDAGDLEHLHRYLEARRSHEHSRVVAALSSTRFIALVESWAGYLESAPSVGSEESLATAPVRDVAGPRILEAFKKIEKRAARVGANTSVSLIHRLRIDSKKLRYLLEFFAELYDSTTVSRLVSELKKLQNVLGVINDTQVQLALVEEFVGQDPSQAGELPAIRQLTDAIADRQQALRSEVPERNAHLVGAESRHLYERTFKAL